MRSIPAGYSLVHPSARFSGIRNHLFLALFLFATCPSPGAVPAKTSPALEPFVEEPVPEDWPWLRIHLEAARKVWSDAQLKSDRIVAVIDGGFNLDHSTLPDSQRYENPGEKGKTQDKDDDCNGLRDDIYGWDYVAGDGHPQRDHDGDNHGTTVAQIIGGAPWAEGGFSGVAPNAKLMLLRWYGASDPYNLTNLLRCVRYAVSQGAHIINLSSTPASFNLAGATELELRDAFGKAADAGVLVVNAVDNEPYDLDDLSGQVRIPAMYDDLDNTIVVTGLLRFPNVGTHLNRGEYGSNRVDIAAPTAGIHGPFFGENYGFTNGNSFAAAIVSGAASLVWGVMPKLTAKEVRCLLLDNASELGVEFRAPNQSWGHTEPATPNGFLDLAFVEAAYEAYRSGSAFGSCFEAGAKDRSADLREAEPPAP